ncbi:trypsin alpha-like [Drosophila miranda]|uniref:trypsin alpha-like n=1 Tax=Drosophila miranda TaxID=7229 RepID=UPI0007E823D1|nr:trypsin alpha-like [Drosophila miranda]
MLFKVSLLFATATLLSAGRVPRIIGGQDTPIEDDSWQVSLVLGGDHACGGSIYSKDFVITAAHCVSKVNPEELQVRAGSTLRSQGGTLHRVAAIKYYPGYSYSEFWKNDIALIRLSEPLEFSDQVRSIPLAVADPEAGAQAKITGWGWTFKNGALQIPDILQGVAIPIVSRECCQLKYPEYGITEAVICAGTSHKSTLFEDSGGPLTLNKELVGVVCGGRYGSPIMYSSVIYHKDWILDAIEALS